MRGAMKDTIDGLRGALAAVAVFSAFVNVLMLTAPLYMLQVFDRVLTSRSVDTLLALSLIAVVALATLAFLEGVRSLALGRAGTWLDRALASVVLRIGLEDRIAGNAGADAQGLRDLNAVRSFISGPAMFPLLDAPWIPLFLGVIFVLHPALGWLALGGACVLLALAVANELVTRRPLQEATTLQLEATHEAEAAIRNADVIEAMGMFQAVARRWDTRQHEAHALQQRASERSGALSALSKFCRLALQIAMLGVGAWLVLGHELTPGGMIAGTILLGRALAPVDQAMGSWRQFVAARGAWARLGEQIERGAAPVETMTLPRPTGRIECEDVTYRHRRTGDPTLKSVSFALEPGRILGIVGPSAAGKTTLARLLIGNLRPALGHVRLDGMDVAAWPSDDRGRHIGYLPQTVELFSGTIRENIARLGPGESEAVIDAAQLAGVHEMVLRLEDGYDTDIGDGGAALSAGQRQRVGLARALYGDPSLVVLDEPNSNLDQTGLDALVGALEALRERGTTVVVVAHQPHVVRHVDALLVLGAGQVQMSGPRDEVLARITRAATKDSPPTGPRRVAG